MKRIWILGLVLALVLTTVGTPVRAKHYSDWSPAVKLTGISTNYSESCPAISRDGLSLYTASNRPPTAFPNTDIYVCQRASVDDPWGQPQILGDNINTADTERCPYVTPDGHKLIFVRQIGAVDYFYMSVRKDKRDDFGWGDPVRIDDISSAGMETAPWGFENENGTLTLYFGAVRPDFPGTGMDIYQSTMDSSGSWTKPVPVTELNDPVASVMDYGPVVRKDGLELFFTSSRAGGFGGWDIWMSTRSSTSGKWSAPVNLGPDINSGFDEWRFSITGDGMNAVFASNRDRLGVGGYVLMDLFTTYRTKVTSANK